ncbi:MAG: hypothetical protein HOY79_33725 [Streptomyces sp.]|nr:hypothetical protein [Streptomyces sp.]NUS11347.1 hypothetical protein [Streptomyces sp.]NUS23377.1 hypothetical protein [Streptomyces sp.]
MLNTLEASAAFVGAVALYAAGPLTAPKQPAAAPARQRPSWARGPIESARYTRTHTRHDTTRRTM